MPVTQVFIQSKVKSIDPFIDMLIQDIIFKEELRMILGYEEVKFYSEEKINRLFSYVASDPTLASNLCKLVIHKVITPDEAREHLGLPSIKETKTKLKNLLYYEKYSSKKREKKELDEE